MSDRVTLVASLTEPPTPEGLRGLAHRADWLEVRADLVDDVSAEWLRGCFPGGLLYTLRSREEGGAFGGSAERRRQLLLRAARTFDMVDLEGERDRDPELVAALPPERRLISWHGPPSELVSLRARFDRMAAIAARFYKLVPAAAQSGDELAPLAFLHSLGREDVVAFAAGEIGGWTRLVAPRFGARVVYGSAGARPAAPGQPSVEELRRDYGLPALAPAERIFGIAGWPVAHSLSPRLHNGVYRELGVSAVYLPFAVESFGDFWLEVVEGGGLEVLGLPLRGLSVSAPYKGQALVVAGAASPLAQTIGAANTLVERGGVWEAEATDPEGVVLPLRERGIAVSGKAAAVVGAGGAGRAVAVGLRAARARVTLVNRGEERGRAAADDLGLPFLALGAFDPGVFDLVVHATPAGRGGEGEEPPFDPAALAPGAALVDLVYLREGPTRLVAAARERGFTAIDGREVLLYQALGQLRLMTGREMPLALGRELLGIAGAAAPHEVAG